ncbi:MAG TPA: hypothetical protein VHV30_08495 [Polyangiaceae bacterium]|jgi:hypothetical protein|nr:hypothetical protein [Polyangiaceae bacterium]
MKVAGNRTKAPVDRDELADSEVPAAVVCAFCGDADCAGCRNEQTRSGVVAIVAWERPGAPPLTRLWATARATTFEADRFFETLPDGPIAPALRFAFASEIIASSSMALMALVPLAVVFPAWIEHVFIDERLAATRLVAALVPALATILVAAHVAHGWALDRGARRAGVRGATTRAIRFGLYAAGWDVVVGPLGAVVVALKEGVRKALSIGSVGVGLPGRSARAFLRGCYRLEGAAAEPALRASYVAAGVATGVGAVAVIGALAAALLL